MNPGMPGYLPKTSATNSTHTYKITGWAAAIKVAFMRASIYFFLVCRSQVVKL